MFALEFSHRHLEDWGLRGLAPALGLLEKKEELFGYFSATLVPREVERYPTSHKLDVSHPRPGATALRPALRLCLSEPTTDARFVNKGCDPVRSRRED